MVDDSQSSSEVMLFMVYVGKWSGVESSVDEFLVMVLVVLGPMMHECAPDISLYSAKGAFWIVLHAYLLELLRA